MRKERKSSGRKKKMGKLERLTHILTYPIRKLIEAERHLDRLQNIARKYGEIEEKAIRGGDKQ